MHELHATEYSVISPLFQDMDYDLAVKAVIKGKAAAKVYADDVTYPCAALIQVKSRFYLGGSPQSTFNTHIKEIIINHIASGDEPENKIAVLYYTPPWDNTLHTLLKDQSPVKAPREYYTFEHLNYDWRDLCPQGFSIKWITKLLLNTLSQAKNVAILKKEMLSERTSIKDFFENSFGVCAVHTNEIAGWCLSEYNTGTQCEIGIETLPPYQKQGIATVTASALIEYALSKGITHIGWHCYKNNVPSVKTALKIGFKKDIEYPVYIVGH
ncbi:MAG: GNAT family N-acetyltransferase [Candidatus Methanofastidiosia archaeon]|jgi:GNAT superfamily N-acetyltransferase